MSYEHVQQSLDFAVSTNATTITLKFDEGTHQVPLADAIAGWDQLLPGGEYQVLGVHWDDPATPLHFSGNEPTETERDNLNELHTAWKLAIAVNNSKGEIPSAEEAAAAAFIEELMKYAQISTED